MTSPLQRLELRLAVRRLDRVVPGWRARVDPATLDMHCVEDCVLGQLFGDYDAGLRAVGARPWTIFDAAFHGGFPVHLWLAELRPARVDDREPVRL